MPRSDATTEWMMDDVAERCREVVETLSAKSPTTTQLGGAAIALRAAADDLASLTELVEGPANVADSKSSTPQGFDLAFDDALQTNRNP